ncbi:MAG: two-component system, OmpR family, response regulator VicR [Acidimicrobiaceae bacterium]|jgi:two-component system alkaline phosphatase synthesis response regulator PhoP
MSVNSGGSRQRVVLVVDDDEAIRKVVRNVLEADGFEVVEASDGPAALLLLNAILGRGPDAVVLDIMMPGIDGIEVCEKIDHSKVKVIMLSARDDGDTRARAAAAGADAYLTKPFSAIELLDAVEKLVPA